MNKCGLYPVEYACVIQLKIVEETYGSIVLSKGMVEKDQWAETEAILVAKGGNAFNDFIGEKPQIGDDIIIRKYAGQQTYDGDDGNQYQFINDKDIRGIDRRGK